MYILAAFLHFLFTYFLVDLFILPYCFYHIQWELIDVFLMIQTCRTLLAKQGHTHKRCTLMDPHTWLCKSRTTSTNIHSAAM